MLLTRSLTDVALMQASATADDYRILPDTSVVKIGGQSLMDRGRAAVFPIVEELVEIKREQKILIGTGAGTRARHLYALATDLGLPTGVLTDIGSAVAGQNAQILGYLLARHGVPVDRLLLELLANAKHVKAVQIVNGLTAGNITKALAGEHVGTIVYAG